MKSLNIPQSKSSPILFLNVAEDGTSRMITKGPTECQQCHTIHYHFVNRGETLCLGCDEKVEK